MDGHRRGLGRPPGQTNRYLFQGFTAGLSYSGGYTAEWIVEAYTQADGSLASLADYGAVTFFNLRTSLTTWSCSRPMRWR